MSSTANAIHTLFLKYWVYTIVRKSIQPTVTSNCNSTGNEVLGFLDLWNVAQLALTRPATFYNFHKKFLGRTGDPAGPS